MESVARLLLCHSLRPEVASTSAHPNPASVGWKVPALYASLATLWNNIEYHLMYHTNMQPLVKIQQRLDIYGAQSFIEQPGSE